MRAVVVPGDAGAGTEGPPGHERARVDWRARGGAPSSRAPPRGPRAGALFGAYVSGGGHPASALAFPRSTPPASRSSTTSSAMVKSSRSA